jgi:hypothetical protein
MRRLSLKQRFSLSAALTLVVACVGVTANVAGAANTGVKATPFTAAYSGGADGYYTCAGVRIVTTWPKASTKDLEVCKITNSTVPAGRYVIPTDTDWFSDYDGKPAVSGTGVVTSVGNGTSISVIVANY